MRKPKKEELRNKLLSYNLRVEQPDAVVDGGAELHRAVWKLNMTFAQVGEKFVSGVESKYGCFGDIIVVFDGYEEEISTKINEHQTRSSTGKIASNVVISGTSEFSEDILSISRTQPLPFLVIIIIKAQLWDFLSLSDFGWNKAFL